MGNNFNNQTQRLVRLAKEGDQSALEQLCRVYNDRALRIVRMRMGPELRTKLESIDLVQDAFISALRSIGSFTYTNEGDFLRWLSTIIENRLRDNFDKFHADKRDIRKEIPLTNNRETTNEELQAVFEPACLTTPSIIMSKQEDLNKLEKAIDKLKPEYKEVIILSKLEELTYQQISSKIGKSPDAVRMLLARAMAELSSTFEEV